MVVEPDVIIGGGGERFSAVERIYAPMVKGAGNTETGKYIALSQWALHLLGENNYHTGGIPIYEVGGEGRCANCVTHVERDLLVVGRSPTGAAISAEDCLKSEGFKELNDVLIRLI